MSVRHWACLERVRRHDPLQRVPVWLQCGGSPSPSRVGSVARDHLPWLAQHLNDCSQVRPDGLWLQWPAAAEADLALRLHRLHRQRQADGLLPGWRDEAYAMVDLDAHPPGTPLPAVLVRIERAASRFWGTLTLGAHCNGYVADAHGRPTHLWIARRSYSKATDPGRLDNLIGGGVPIGQTPFEALVREGWEEAGLAAAHMRQARAGGVYALLADIAEGLQREHLHVFDLALPDGLTPQNQDGEVHEFLRLGIDDALALAAGTEMTVDAALTTLDFALRHGLLRADEHAHLQALTAVLREPLPETPGGH